MSPSRSSPLSDRLSFAALAIVSIVLIALALLALYARVQESRRGKIENVLVTRVATPVPSSTASP